jgi:hypothetical protein
VEVGVEMVEAALVLEHYFLQLQVAFPIQVAVAVVLEIMLLLKLEPLEVLAS